MVGMVADLPVNFTQTKPVSFTLRWSREARGPTFSLRVWVGYPRGYPEIVGVEMWGVEPVPQLWQFEGEPGPRDAVPGTPLEALPDAPIKAEDIHGLRLGELLDKWKALYGSLAAGQPDTPRRADFLKRLQASAPQNAKTNRLSPEFLEGVAHVYMSAVRGGTNPGEAVKEWAASLPGAAARPAADSTVRGWFRKAENMGYLPKTSQGRVRRG